MPHHNLTKFERSYAAIATASLDAEALIITSMVAQASPEELPQEVDITKGSKGFQFEPKIAFITGPGDDDDDIDIGDITIGDDLEIIDIDDMLGPPKLPISAPTKPIPSSEDEINRPLSLSCCKKCDNGMYTNRCFPFDTENDEDCIFPTLEVCEDESEPRLPSMLDIFA